MGVLEEGLFDEVVFRFLEDRTGDLWMTSNRGVARVSMVDLTAVAEGRKDRLSMEVYGPSDGLATPECNGGSQPAGWVAASGKVWLPTPRGLAVVQPERAVLPVPTPVMVLEGFTADGRVRDPRQAVVLPAGTREVSISFTALSFISPSRLRFRYRLEGLSDAWKDGGQAREVAYSRLPPGRYRFQVQARNRRSGWADPPAAVTFTVRAFLWQMPVFWAVSAVALVLLGFALAQGTAARLRRRADELRRLVEDRTRDLLHTTLDLEDANARLEELSQRDPLTGLANRRFMDERATALLEEAAGCFRRGHYQADLFSTLRTLARTRIELGRRQQARHDLDEARKVALSLGNEKLQESIAKDFEALSPVEPSGNPSQTGTPADPPS